MNRTASFLSTVSVLGGAALSSFGCGAGSPSAPPLAGAGSPPTIAGASAGGNLGSGGTAEASGGMLVQVGGNAASGGSGGQSGGGGGTDSSAGGSAAAGSSSIAGAAGSAGGAGATGGTAGKGSTSCAGMLLCDDFESFAIAAQPSGQWKTTTTGSGSALVDTTHAYSGTKALHFHGTVNHDEAYVIAQGAPVFPVTSDTLFVRFMMYIERWSIGNPMHNRLVWVGSSGALTNQDGTGYAMETYNGIGVERIASGHFRTTAQHLTDASNLGKWLCWEMEIDNKGGPIPTGTGTALPHLFREGTELSLAISGNKDNWNAVPFNLLQFSLFAYQSDTAPADYWVDDIAMSSKRIGCPSGP